MTLELIENLVNNKKYKKALLLIKKQIKKEGESLIFLTLEARCYFYSKQFKQSALVYKKLLNYSLNNDMKVAFLNNLATIHGVLKEYSLALESYGQSISLCSSAKNAFAREQYCIISLQINLPNDTLTMVDPLLSITQYADKALVLKLDAALALSKTVIINNLLKSIEIKLNHFNQKNIFQLIKVLRKHTYENELKAIFIANAQYFKAESWYKTVVAEVEPIAKENKTAVTFNKYVVEGTNDRLITLIEELIHSNELQGAFFSPTIKIVANDFGLSIKTRENIGINTRLIEIPIECLPLLCDYNLTIKNETLICKPKKQQANPSANNSMALMVEIYNETNKLADWKQSSPFFNLLTQPDLLSMLIDGKKYNHKIMNFYKLALNGDFDDLLLSSFIGSRIFCYKKEELKKQGVKIAAQTENGLLSVIDFINHKVDSTFYKSEGSGVNINSPAGQSSDAELYVQYNYFDPLTTLLVYGFVDLTAPNLFSVPIEISLINGQKVEISGNNPQGNNTVSEQGKHFSNYLPKVIELNSGFKLDNLSIPDQNSIDLLRNILITVVKSIFSKSTLNDETLLEEVYSIERQVLQLNLEYWNNLERVFKLQKNMSVLASEQVGSLITFSKMHIKNYANHFGIVLF
ncbi:hypothetical protein [Pseudoalteromonas sp. TB64]|uniref:hypothetical protein n=1 Tax=Pseudoalteromonas sp. TB64 TaxID=1938600 RepID=UPI000427AB1C|nr:hypothetical protein [Pseudoalteromonas sp. TB64]